jgi:hypothetical protein
MAKTRLAKNRQESAQKLSKAAALMGESLTQSTGLREIDWKIVTYWSLGTHSLPHVDTYPILSVLGKMGTGKTQVLKIVTNFSYRPHPLSLRGMTDPTIRDAFAAAYEGTAVLEEADYAWKDKDGSFERMLSDRYQRSSAVASHKVPSEDKSWQSVSKNYFGATALHRRIGFIDAALDGRAIQVRTRPDHSRRYEKFNADANCNAEGRELIGKLKFDPPAVEQPQNVAGRIFDSYRAILSTARFCGDEAFLGQLMPILLSQTAELKEAQSSEPDGLVLRAIMEAIYVSGTPAWRNIKYNELSESIWKSQRVSLLPRQIGPLVRELGFETKKSHGSYVVVPTPASLLRACDDCEYTDESIEELRRLLTKPEDE